MYLLNERKQAKRSEIQIGSMVVVRVREWKAGILIIYKKKIFTMGLKYWNRLPSVVVAYVPQGIKNLTTCE